MSSQISPLRWRLLLAYLLAMAAILGTFATAVYFFYSRSLDRQWNKELLALAKATRPSLEIVKSKESKSLKKDWDKNHPWHHLKDWDKNYPLHHLIEPEQGLEWFNAEGKLLAKVGNVVPNFPLATKFSQVGWQKYSTGKPQQNDQKSVAERSSTLLPADRHSPRIEPFLKAADPEQDLSFIQQQGQIRSVTIPVYTPEPNQKMLRLEGYIRASESTTQVEAALNQFRVGLGIGKIIALILSSISAVYFLRLALKSNKLCQERLKHLGADASHELRNPLTALNTTVELMQSNPEQLNSSNAKKLAIIASASEQIKCLVEDLLFLVCSDTTTSRSHLEESPIPLDEVLEDLVERLGPQVQSKRINFESRLPSGISVKGDTNLLIRLFSNLLENALKYTEEGGRVILSLDKRRQFAVVCLDDTGVGIPSESLPFVYQRLWRVDKGRSQQRQGLGLAIAEAIVERHQGKIKVCSKEGVGSCFQVHLPLFL